MPIRRARVEEETNFDQQKDLPRTLLQIRSSECFWSWTALTISTIALARSSARLATEMPRRRAIALFDSPSARRANTSVSLGVSRTLPSGDSETALEATNAASADS